MIKGKYRIYEDGSLVGEYKNIITDQGFNIIRNYLAGNSEAWAGAISLGALNLSTPSSSDISMEFEISRYNIDTSGVRGNNIVLSAEIDIDFSGKIYELGIYPTLRNEISDGFDDRVIATFNENWMDQSGVSLSSSNFSGSEDSPLARSGYRSIIFNDSALTTYAETSVGISGYSDLDSISILYKTAVLGADKTIRLTFYDNQLPTAGTRYYDFQFDGTALGYKKVSQLLGYFTETGNFNGDVSKVELSSLAGDFATIHIDGIKFDDSDETNPDFALISRALIGQAGGDSSTDYFEKRAGASMSIEYEMELI